MYSKISKGWLKHWDFEILDIIALELAFYLAYLLRHNRFFATPQPLLSYIYIRLGVLLIVFDIVVVFFTNNYKGIIQRSATLEFAAVVKHVSLVEIMILLFEYVMKETFFFSRMVFLVSWGLSVVLCFTIRLLWKKHVRNKITDEKNQSNMMVISPSARAKNCVDKLLLKEYREYKISCIVIGKNEKLDGVPKECHICYGEADMLEYVKTSVVDEVFIDTYVPQEDLEDRINVFLSMGITVHVGMGFLPENLPNQFMETIGISQSVTTTIRTAPEWQLTIKRLMDIIGGIVGLIITGIAFIFVAPAIKKESPGPVFYKQERVGKNGRIFHIYKFRSMYMDADQRKQELMDQNEMQGFMFKMENDPRIIGSQKGPGKGIGNFIRKTSIDELPQFWNILIGEMSMVGTRPPTVDEFQQYDLHHKIRLSMKPGLTGMWQVKGRNQVTDFEQVVALDTEYIESWSIGLDVKLLFKTFEVVFKGEGAK